MQETEEVGRRRGVYHKMADGVPRFDTRPPILILSLFVGSFRSWVGDPRRRFSSYQGEYAEARKGSRVYPLFPWLASYGYTFIRR